MNIVKLEILKKQLLEVNNPVVISQKELDYLRKGCSVAIRNGLFKVRLFNNKGICYGLQG